MKRTIAAAMSLVLFASGCMVGPDYVRPKAPLAESYRDSGSTAVKREPADIARWWTVFGDGVLDNLVETACKQNPTLQSAAVRILQAQAREGIAVGLLFPQQQDAFGSYTRNVTSLNRGNAPKPPEPGPFSWLVGNTMPQVPRHFGEWGLGAAASWELDVWGHFRRGIESADAEVMAAVANYDDVLVSLIGQVGTEYVTIRILQERLAVLKANVDVQKGGLDIAEARFKGGTATDLDRSQATTLLRDTEAFIPEVEAGIIQGQNRLCVLMGMPPKDLTAILADTPQIPSPPASVAVGIPADLLRRRPDIRRAERNLAAQCARIGIVKADLYPSFSLTGDFRVTAGQFSKLFESRSIEAFAGPEFRWAILNYGRIENAVRVQDADFQALIGEYENVVLVAQSEVENAIAGYLGAQRSTVLLGESVTSAKRAVDVAQTQYKGGTADYTRVLNTQQALQQEQDRLVSSRGAVALNLVSLYRSLGGGWESRGNRIEIDQKVQAQMRERTDWDRMLPATQPAK